MERVDAIVIGAGVVGLACARALAQSGREVVILERAGAFGTETSARNSEVIHAGLYYPPGSAKARHCARGRQMLYDYCAARGIAHRQCGKLIVAAEPAQEADLDGIRTHAAAAGVTNLEWLTGAQVRAMEPELRATAALHSPFTGIVDSHGFMLSLLGEAEEAGAMLALNAPVEGGEATGGGIRLRVGGAEPMTLETGVVINAAGLWAQPVARAIDGMPPALVPELHFARGTYFSLAGRQPFSRPVYPVPEPGGLGVHYTVDLAGQGKFGPDVEWIDRVDYSVDPDRAARFYDAIRSYWPGLADGALQPSYAGVRPKTAGPGGTPTDFMLQGPQAHGVPGLVNLFGIESPGLTSALSLADEVMTLL
ncbi:NAD(P)/FAD-dependent oxidoreductase [Halovulum dunhuangense]|uniref:NAD(P)/FAD-dependent oxidoreductase n=1 Tax=Halovulum dunhuangense TaxID=1505036 RepID=A0A849L217_9RHOB|nr:NAD(P)/FAD-dependent oxidoreductase [Halovulum dunhuangense]NNU80315.1 NAD(P)/FAD-dependent oxidoreductase [Halovulum dunhuangense]